MSQRFWLMKSEPNTFSIQDLKDSPNQTTYWEGVRNYQARNMMRDDFQVGDGVLFYHSRVDPSIVGTATVVRAGYPDHTAFEPGTPYFDPKSKPDQPTWFMVDIQLQAIFATPLRLPELREVPELQSMVLLQKGSRLSVQPVTAAEFQTILRLAGQD